MSESKVGNDSESTVLKLWLFIRVTKTNQRIHIRLMAEHDEFSAEMLEKLSKRIKSIRKEKGYSNYENFAFTHGFNRVQYGRYEKGSDLRFTSLARIVKAFDMTLQEFFSEGFD